MKAMPPPQNRLHSLLLRSAPPAKPRKPQRLKHIIESKPFRFLVNCNVQLFQF